MLTCGQRRLPQLPVAVSRVVWLFFALLLAVSGFQAALYVIAGGFIPLLFAVALIAASIGIFLLRPWAYRIALAYPLLTITAILLRPVVRAADSSLRTLSSALYEVQRLPLGTIAASVAHYFNWWGLPLAVGSIAFLLAIFVFLFSAQRQPASTTAEATSAEPIPRDLGKQRTVLTWIARACGLLILLPILGVVVVALGDKPGVSPGGFGGGYHTIYATLVAAPLILAGAIGLAITLILRRNHKP